MTLTGGCLCGAVRYTAAAAAEGIVACHCSQCRAWSGHVWAAIDVTDLRVTGAPRWFRSSDRGERGFCDACGSALFWRDVQTGATEVSGGSLDAPTGQRLIRHVWTGDKGDYYEIADGLPQCREGSA